MGIGKAQKRLISYYSNVGDFVARIYNNLINNHIIIIAAIHKLQILQDIISSPCDSKLFAVDIH